MKRNELVIENSRGQVVRTIHWEQSHLVVYVNQDTGRVEVANDQTELRDVDFAYTVLGQVDRSHLEKSPFPIQDRGQLRLAGQDDKVANLVFLENENPEELKKISKWTAITHAVLALLLLIGSFVFRTIQPEVPPVVTVFRQETLEKPKVVKMAEKKIIKQNFKARVSNRTVKPKQVVKTVARKRPSPVRTQVSVSKVGALGALGGMANGLKGSAGFNVNATNASLGTGLKEIGKGGAGGFERAAHGKALVSGPVGTGGAKGSGGYATRGKGGGRPGYGTMSMVGGSSGYYLPLEEEALIEGGLDKDQIAAVIQRHLGEVIYCYEKGLQVQSSLSGRVAMHWVIGPQGNVGIANVQQSSLKSAAVEGCILNRLRTWKFPKPYGGVNVKVTYPFVLRRVG